VRAVILAGGRGTRLRPFTTSFPKPLMPVGDLPVLEILMRRLQVHGITDVTLLTGHLAYMIEGYFGDGADRGMRISYVREETPLGTAGPLAQMRGRLDDDFLVMNGDLLTDVDFSAMVDHHHVAGADMTVGMRTHQERLELGVLSIDETGHVTGYQEKPTLELPISMGLYIISPGLLDLIPDGRYDMPQLVIDALAAGRRVTAYGHGGFWLDIGRVEDYARANEEFSANPEAFLSR
jgi:NDP-mannose synthase